MVALTAILSASGASAADDEPAVIDPLADGELSSGAELAGSVRALELTGSVRPLEPEVRRLEPEVRRLEPGVRELRTEEREGTATTVTISTDVLFAFDSAELTRAAHHAVEDVAARIAETDGDIKVVGHTDAIGSREYNQHLSEQRAAAVAGLLREQLGEDRTIAAAGRNFSDPLEPERVGEEDNPEGRARNRRVEITFEET